jgi:hypothetical protein
LLARLGAEAGVDLMAGLRMTSSSSFSGAELPFGPTPDLLDSERYAPRSERGTEVAALPLALPVAIPAAKAAEILAVGLVAWAGARLLNNPEEENRHLMMMSRELGR